MLNRIVLTFFVFILTALQVFAQTDIVSGNAKTYAGDTLKMYKVDDYISKNESLIATAKVDSEGNFQFSVKVKECTLAYIDLTVFKGLIYLQPGKKQEIVLPDKQQIAIQDKLNPYFKKTEFFVKLVNGDESDLNNLIPSFERLYNQALAKVFYSRKGLSKAATDSIENIIDSQIKSADPFFAEYKKYRFALLDYSAYHRSKEDIVKQYFAGKDILTNNMAYSELFDEMFYNVFNSGKTSAIYVKDLYTGIYDKSYYSIKKMMLSHPLVENDRFADYLILKGLKDSYYSNSIPKENIVAVLDSMMSTCKNKDFRKIAGFLHEKFTTLLCGFSAPQFSLQDISGAEYNLQKFAGKFVYLNFYNPGSYTAISDLILMKQLRKDYPSENLEIVTIFVSADKNDMKKFLDSNPDISWKVLWYNSDDELLKKYDVRVYPTYYLINPNGILSMNPAPSPQENFGVKFYDVLRNWRNDQYRQQYRQSQGIK